MIPLDQNPSRRGRYGKDWHGMSEKGLERETEGISVGEREPVVADSSPKGGRLRSSWKKLWKGRKRKALALLLVVAIAGGVVIWRGRGQTASAATTYQEAAADRRRIDLKPLLPGMRSCELAIGENGRATLLADNGNVRVSRELTPAEMSRLSAALNDGTLSEEARRMRVAGLLNSVVLAETASRNFELGMAEQRGQTENLKR